MAALAKDPITCHVLDTTTGRPAADISVKLICPVSPKIVFDSKTNADGRIMQWSITYAPDQGEGAVAESRQNVSAALHAMIKTSAQPTATSAYPAGLSIWKLEFDTGAYYGAGNTFFPKVELTFLVKEGEHFHVPLLLGPYSFTTYRGS